jgi:vitamin B12/bleomycin/antimicrobial peptide transport system ATP-binding/permease protein
MPGPTGAAAGSHRPDRLGSLDGSGEGEAAVSGVDWSTEWFTSIVWIVSVTLAAAAGTALVGWLLVRSTQWGRQFRRLAFPFFSPRGPEGWGPLATALLLLLLTIVGVRLNVLLSYNGNEQLTTLQRLDAPGFARVLGIFGVLATVYVANALLTYYVTQRLTIRLWTRLTEHVLGDWFDGAAYHRDGFTSDPIDNPDQRIQQDIASFPVTTISLTVGAISSVVSLVSFTLILWSLSGPLSVLGLEIPRAMTFVAYLFVIVATVVAFRVGRPLIRLNFMSELLAASYRYALVRLRVNSEQVAFHRGEPVEQAVLQSRFRPVIGNAWDRVFRTLKFDGWNLVVSQALVVVPYLVQAPRYFSQAITLGDLTQTSIAFGQVTDSLSFFRNAYDTFAGYRAVLIRLTGLLDSDEEGRALPSVDVEPGEGVEVRDLTVRLPDDQVLVDDLDLSLAPGASLFVTGRSGSGKTTLLRSLADLWPWAQGTVRRPVGDDALFLSQQPYLPLGSLRAGLAYPRGAGEVTDDRAADVLRQVQLPHLVDRLDEEGVDWSRRLSPGEQQRLGFARVLLTRPRVVFLDEATSALDEGLEQALYTLVREELPESVVVSVGHRSTLSRFHAERLELLGEGRWRVGALQN